MCEYSLAQQFHLKEFEEKMMHKDAQLNIICEQ